MSEHQHEEWQIQESAKGETIDEARKEALSVWPFIREMNDSFYGSIGELGVHMAQWQKRREDNNE